MFEDKNIQFVNIKKQDNQLIVDNKILKNNKIIKTNHSSFLVEDELSKDAISKLNILQQDYSKTFLSTLCESKTQLVVKANEFNDDNYEIKRLNSNYNIAIEKSEIDSLMFYYKDTGLDYIFSPFAILYDHIISNGANTNSLNILILNNTVYALILDNDKKIVFSSAKLLSAFNDIQSSEFYENDIEGQQLFDEVHYLEVQETITEITNEFYEQSQDDVFCESISIAYTIKQLNEEQITSLQEAIMLEVEYGFISIEDYIFNMLKQPNIARDSFIQPREKKDKKAFIMLLVAVLITTVLGAGIFFYIQEQDRLAELKKIEEIKKAKAAKLLALKKAEAAKVKLPNHQVKNKSIIKLTLSIFDIIPFNTVLNELQIGKTNSTFVCNFLNKDTYQKDIQPKLLNMYKKSELLLIQNKKAVYNAIISNTKMLPQEPSTKEVEFKYKKHKYFTQTKVRRNVEPFLPKDSDIKYISKKVKKFTTYKFEVSTVFNTPQEFFTFVENLNKKPNSINIQYPIEFAKTKQGLETKFKLEFHQFNKKKSIKNK